jgi:hypothetical protein
MAKVVFEKPMQRGGGLIFDRSNKITTVSVSNVLHREAASFFFLSIGLAKATYLWCT